MREQCDPAAGTQIRIKANPIGPCYYYEIDGHLSAAHYADAQSAFGGCPPTAVCVSERVLFVLAMQALRISACH